MIDRGKRIKALNEVKPIENISRNTQSFLETGPVQKEVLPSLNCKTMHMSNRIFSH